MLVMLFSCSVESIVLPTAKRSSRKMVVLELMHSMIAVKYKRGEKTCFWTVNGPYIPKTYAPNQ
jgi:hypothetical protein